jgi:rubrerythrin
MGGNYMDFLQSESLKNLARAFAGECQAGARYQFVAKKAMEEGFPEIQNLVKTIAKEEMAHAKVYWDLIAEKTNGKNDNIEICAGYPFKSGNLGELLKFARDAERSENTSVYPAFAKIAEDEGFMDVAETFKKVAVVENCHYLLFDQLYNMYTTSTLYKQEESRKWKCSQCGYEADGKTPWKTCPLCGLPQGYVQIPVQK